ncbi:type II toxin-antitoxin system PemK/MazF family toxin (plasmid) [Carnobacterium maltaromaticum]|uniref:type II toxin-antitoxin system PemK/MazF family toxin n=1 Tax=Carnobacterium maltaromaticum TaxID=2751 RepID=UPI00344FB60D
MVFHIHGYTPKRGDIVAINFDPSIGREIKKKRPGIVISSNEYNATTGMIAVCPITSTKNVQPHFIKIDDSHQVEGHINPLQVKTFDFIAQARNVRFIEKATLKEIGETAQMVGMIFDFTSLITE